MVVLLLLGLVLVGLLMMAVLASVSAWLGTDVRGRCEECSAEVSYGEIVRIAGPGVENESLYCSRKCARGTAKTSGEGDETGRDEDGVTLRMTA
jgi:hypothetical protein